MLLQSRFIEAVTQYNSNLYVAHRAEGNQWKEQFIPSSKFNSYTKSLIAKETDTYVTCVTFRSVQGGRSEDNIFGYRAFAIDVDMKGHKSLTEREATTLIEWIYQIPSMPQPSFAIYSGRGLQLWWFIDLMKHTPQYMKLYKEIQKHLRETLQQHLDDLLGIGEVKIDNVIPHGLYRLPGTFNTKGNAYAEVIQQGPIENYNFFDFFGYFEVSTKKEKAKTPTPVKSLKRASLAYEDYVISVGIDLTTISKEYARRGVNEGYRDKFLFTYALLLQKLNLDEEKQLSLVNELNNTFNEPLSETVVKQKIASAQRYYKNIGSKIPQASYIIEFCDLTSILTDPVVAAEMKMLLPKDELKRRKSIRNAKRKRNQVAIAKKQERENLIKKVKAMRNEGYTHQQIANKYNLSLRTTKRYCAM